jgi:hypothetical protein
VSEGQRTSVVLLGASNMTRGLAVLSALGRHAWGEIDIFAALGLGRSYGLTSSILGRALPPILESGLWGALAGRAPGPLYAVVGDVGNDLLYGEDVETILRWVDECVARLAGAGARIVLTSLPPGLLELPRARFLFFRGLLFWRSPLRYESLPTMIPALDEGLRAIAERHGTAFVALRQEWYGLDPIHIRAPYWHSAWAEILSALTPIAGPPTVSVIRSLQTFALLAERQWIFGREISARQPCLQGANGTRVSLY